MNDLESFRILLNKSGLTKLSALLKDAKSNVDMSSQYGSYMNSVVSSFDLLVSPNVYDEVEKTVEKHQELMLECAKKLYPDNDNAPEIVAVCTRILREENDNQEIEGGVDQHLLESLLGLSKSLPEANKYTHEAASCYKNLLLRSSVNMIWQLFIFALFKRIEIYGLPSFVQKAKQKNVLKNNVEYPHDLNKIKDTDLIQLCHECGFYDQNVRNDLQANDRLRNSCSHVSFNEISRQKVETFLVDIVAYINLLLADNKSAISTADDNFLFLSACDPEKFAEEYSKLTPQQEIELIKQCFYYLSRENILGKDGVDKSEKLLRQVIDYGGPASKLSKIKRLISQSAKYNFFPEFIKNILPLYFKNPSFEKIFGNDIDVRNDLINLYTNSNSFDEAKRRRDLPFYIIEYINDEEKGRLTESILNNPQINGSWHSRHSELLSKLNYKNEIVSTKEMPF